MALGKAYKLLAPTLGSQGDVGVSGRKLGKAATRWNVSVPKLLDEAVEEAVRRGVAFTKSDFVRGAVLERLNRLGFFDKKLITAIEEACQGEG
jgi:hypothetical protein